MNFDYSEIIPVDRKNCETTSTKKRVVNSRKVWNEVTDDECGGGGGGGGW